MNSRDRVVENAPPVFRRDAYPRTYRIRRNARIATYVMASVLVAIEIAAAIAIAFGPRRAPGAVPIGVIAAGFLLFAALATESTRRWRVTLEADAIETLTLLGRRRLERRDIAGWRVVRLREFALVVLRAAGSKSGPKRVSVPVTVEADDAFDAWFDSIPNLNASAEEQRSARE